MFTDMVDSTHLAQTDERTALALIEEQERIARPIVEAHHGRLVKSTGDGLLLELPSALDAIESAVELQKQVLDRNARPGVVALRLRVGVHLGDVQRRDQDIFGDAVNVAARVESAAEAGGIVISESVYNQVRNKVHYGLEPLGPQVLKGVSEPIGLYRVGVPGAAAAPSRAAHPRLAVLPLANISPDAKDEYFADGLTEELIAVLSKIPGLRVIARTSVVPYKSSAKSVAQIGSELGVGSILEGSVRKAGDRLRITLQLIDVPSQEHVWSERYDRELSDVFAIQTEVAESTAKAIRVELSDRAREFIRRSPTSDLAAYELYLRAILRADELDHRWFRESIEMLEEAIRRDPEFALAYAQLGHRFVQAAGDYLPHHEGLDRARALITRALELDPELSEAHSALGNLAMQADHDWPRAEREFERAITLNPSNTMARVSYSTLLRVLGRFPEAEHQLRMAVETDPKSATPRWLLVDIALMHHSVADAQARLRELLPEDPSPRMTHVAFAVRYAMDRRTVEAHRELELAGPPTALLVRVGRAIVLAMIGEPQEARALLAELEGGAPHEFVSNDFVAMLYSVIGEKEKALTLLETLKREGESGLWLRYSSPAFDPIRGDPRFLAALQGLRLPAEVLERAVHPLTTDGR